MNTLLRSRCRTLLLVLPALFAAAVPAIADDLPWRDSSLKIIQTTEPDFPPDTETLLQRRGEARLVINVDADGHLVDWLVTSYTHRNFATAAVNALKGVDMQVAPGEVVGLIGPSGSGKSTLLKCLGAVIDPTAGRMTLGDEVIYDDGWKVRDLRALRRDKIGFVFQAPYLIPFLDVTDNVALLPMLAGVANGESRAKALELLTALDVQHRARAMPSQLSGGEQQRVAIARGLVNRPPVILADEPTAPLDSERAMAVIRILNDMARKFETAIIVVTHDEKIIPTFKRIYHIRDGVTHEEAGEGREFE